jgi:hypothetical protein
MAEELSAFRVLNEGRNTSAPGIGTHLRSQFEFAHILRHYPAMRPDLLRAAFARDCAQAGIETEGPPAPWLAQLALSGRMSSHRLFALETLFSTAQTDADMHRLRDLTGRVDLCNTVALAQRDAEVAMLRRPWSRLCLAIWRRLNRRPAGI